MTSNSVSLLTAAAPYLQVQGALFGEAEGERDFGFEGRVVRMLSSALGEAGGELGKVVGALAQGRNDHPAGRAKAHVEVLTKGAAGHRFA